MAEDARLCRMCGRYNITTDVQGLIDAYQVISELTDDYDRVPTYNAAPTQHLPIVRNGKLEAAHWGLVPFWAKDTKTSFRMINARCETISEKRSFKGPFEKHRCLVPITGWYEWRKEDDVKQPYLFETGGVMSLAGICAWNGDLEMLSYSIITTSANTVAEPYHHRMPVMLAEHQHEMWLDSDTDLEQLSGALVPYEGNDLSVRKVSRRVGNVRNNDAELLAED